jgi:hypothetical protein
MFFPLTFLLVQHSLGQNLITNGGFETHVPVNSECQKVNCESTNVKLIEPWTLLGSAKKFKIIGGSLPQKQGNVSIHLNVDGNPYAIGQSITTKTSGLYTATFQLSINPCSPEIPKVGYVKVGTKKQVFEGSRGWNQMITFNFTATGTKTLLEIGSSTKGSCGPRIDEVKVVLVSVPKSTTVVNPVVTKKPSDTGKPTVSDSPNYSDSKSQGPTEILSSEISTSLGLVSIISLLMTFL